MVHFKLDWTSILSIAAIAGIGYVIYKFWKGDWKLPDIGALLSSAIGIDVPGLERFTRPVEEATMIKVPSPISPVTEPVKYFTWQTTPVTSREVGEYAGKIAEWAAEPLAIQPYDVLSQIQLIPKLAATLLAGAPANGISPEMKMEIAQQKVAYEAAKIPYAPVVTPMAPSIGTEARIAYENRETPLGWRYIPQ